MPRATRLHPRAVPSVPLRLGTALRERAAPRLHGRDLRADLLAGIVVGIVALPLSMALAVASGVAPQHGLYTAIVAGAVIARPGRLDGAGLRPHGGLRGPPRADLGAVRPRRADPGRR